MDKPAKVNTEAYAKALSHIEKELASRSENYIIIEISSTSYIMPAKVGVGLVNALQQAEELRFPWDYEEIEIVPQKGNKLNVKFMSAEIYNKIKVARLMQVTPESLIEGECEDIPF